MAAITRVANSDRTLNIVGDSLRNADGGSRQAEVKLCRVGEPVELLRKAGGRHDPPGVAVISCRGVQLGHLKAEQARWIGTRMDEGAPIPAIIERIDGGTPDRPNFGIAIRLNVDGITPTAPRRSFLDRLLRR